MKTMGLNRILVDSDEEKEYELQQKRIEEEKKKVVPELNSSDEESHCEDEIEQEAQDRKAASKLREAVQKRKKFG